jgi:hypothetical protein
LVAVSLFVSCNQPDRSHYTIADRSTPVAVTANDLGIPATVAGSVGVQKLGGSSANGRFPAAICVARVVAREGGESRGRHLRIADFSAHHKVYWNQLLDEQPAVREVLFLTGAGLDPRGYDRHAILDAARLRGADLCVIYARVPTSEADAAYLGALWDVRDQTPLVGLRSVGVLPAELAVELAAEQDESSLDPSVREADFRAEQDFRRMFRDGVWDMVEADQGTKGGEQNPWRGYVPPRDRPWRGMQDLLGPTGKQP